LATTNQIRTQLSSRNIGLGGFVGCGAGGALLGIVCMHKSYLHWKRIYVTYPTNIGVLPPDLEFLP